ncbi:hypothetical protein D3C81_2059670 [compost metagenome]
MINLSKWDDLNSLMEEGITTAKVSISIVVAKVALHANNMVFRLLFCGSVG